MDLNRLIARVTDEVRAQVQSLPVGSSAVDSPAGDTVVLYTRAVAGLLALLERLVAEGGTVALLIPQHGAYGVDVQRIKEIGVRVSTVTRQRGQFAWPEGANRFTRLLLPGLHEVAVREVGGLLDAALARARQLAVPAIALHGSDVDGSAGPTPTWLPAGVQWQPMATYGGPRGPGRRAAELAPMIDHTLLRADATEADVRQLCAEAAEWKFASVCVNPSWVPLASQQLKGTGVMVCTVIGFPLGATDARSKGDETRHAVAAGADEIDMVLNVGAMKSKDYETVARDIAAVVQAAAGKTVKVILETVYLSDEEKVAACLLSRETGAHFVKTSTGFGPGGATAADIALMRRIVGPVMGVKASGGIRDTATALKMVEAGASRLGCSASVAIVKGASASGGGY